MHLNVFFLERKSSSFCCSTIKKLKELRRHGIAKVSLGLRKQAVSVELMAVSEDSYLFIFIRFNNRGEQVLTELFCEDSVDLCGDHPAFLIRLYRRVMLLKALTDDVGLDTFCSAFNEVWIGVDGLS